MGVKRDIHSSTGYCSKASTLGVVGGGSILPFRRFIHFRFCCRRRCWRRPHTRCLPETLTVPKQTNIPHCCSLRTSACHKTQKCPLVYFIVSSGDQKGGSDKQRWYGTRRRTLIGRLTHTSGTTKNKPAEVLADKSRHHAIRMWFQKEVHCSSKNLPDSFACQSCTFRWTNIPEREGRQGTGAPGPPQHRYASAD